jgi:CBS domain-containing membrane protein
VPGGVRRFFRYAQRARGGGRLNLLTTPSFIAQSSMRPRAAAIMAIMSPSPNSLSRPDQTPRFQLFQPILAGATFRERVIACLGAMVCIGLTAVISGILVGRGPSLPLIVAPIGASAVLLFAIPASPLAQPWPIIGGNTISAVVGTIVGYLIKDPAIAIAVGVSLAIGAMSLTRSLHPPGGAAALTAVLGGQAVAGWGLLFPFIPVGMNSCIIVGLGVIFHRLSKRSYPHVAPKAAVNTHQTSDIPPQARVGFREEDVDRALAALDETFDIDRGDLSRLLQQVELQATIRTHTGMTCDDIMSRDVISIDQTATREQALALLLKHNIRTLPIRDEQGRLSGTIGLRELMLQGAESIEALKSGAATAAASEPAVALLPVLTDGRTHAVIVIDDDRRIRGLISQTDLLSAVARSMAESNAPSQAS